MGVYDVFQMTLNLGLSAYLLERFDQSDWKSAITSARKPTFGECEKVLLSFVKAFNPFRLSTDQSQRQFVRNCYFVGDLKGRRGELSNLNFATQTIKAAAGPAMKRFPMSYSNTEKFSGKIHYAENIAKPPS